MIAHIKGRVLKVADKGIILSTAHLGYFIHLTNELRANVEKSQEIELFIHSHIKEDAFDLYGFSEFEDLELFKKLITISGIGPKVGMEILNLPQEKISSAIANEDEAFLCRIPGIGKKTAKRIILDLKDKIAAVSDREYRSLTEESHNDVIQALVKLGYQKAEIINFLKALPENLSEPEEIIGYFLKNA
jgi:Holliday junction DNA helicase RuvA